MKTQKFLLTIIFQIIFINLYSQVVINEISTNDSISYNGKAYNWIELYNGGTSSVNLSNYAISNDSTNINKWKFPNISIKSKSYIQIIASGKDSMPKRFLHLNFKLSNAGEKIIFSDTNGVIIDLYSVGGLQINNSMGRSPDGSPGWCIFTKPSPFAANLKSICYTGYEPDPVLSLDAGFYPSAQTVTLSSTSSTGIIKYTITGDFPVNTSPTYNQSIPINKTLVLSAKTFSKANLLPSNTVKNTYFINENLASLSLPVFSISTNQADLFNSSTGIYATGSKANSVFPYYGANFWQPWKKLAHLEYFDKKKKQRFETNVEISIDGTWSRAYAQKSLKININKRTSGFSTIHYVLIPDKNNVTEYHSFTLRNAGQDLFGARMRDAFMQRVMKNSYADYISCEPAIVFLNGTYWGHYEIRENQNENYISQNNNVPDNKIDFFVYKYGYFVQSGSDTSFLRIHKYIAAANPQSPNFYSSVTKMLDIKNYADYFIGEIFCDNHDWLNTIYLGNNLKLWHSQLPGGTWNYLFWDLDFGLGFQGAPNINTIGLLRTHSTPSPHVDIFKKIVNNITFRNYFVNRFADYMNTAFQLKNMQKIAFAMRDSMKASMPRHFQKWSGQSYAGWLNAVTQMVNYAGPRVGFVRSQIISEFKLKKQVNVTLDVFPSKAGRIQISTIVPDSFPWSGIYFDGVPVTITAIPNPGFDFKNWKTNKMINSSDTLKESITLNISSNNKFIANFTGNTMIPLKITFSEINYNSDPSLNSGDWIEIHNYGNATIDLTGWSLKNNDSLTIFKIPMGTVLPSNDYLVFVNDTSKFINQYPLVKNFIGQIQFGLKKHGDQISLSDFYGKIYLQLAYTDSLPWPLGAGGHGRTLELLDQTANINNGMNWFDGCIGGSPGKAYHPCMDNIVFSEINYHSSKNNDAGNWIELRNLTSQNIDISGWKLEAKKKDSIYILPPKTILPSLGYLVICNNISKFITQHPTVKKFVGPFHFKLDKGGEPLKLRDDLGKLQFSMSYSDSLPWPLEADGKGKTLEVLDPNGIIDNGLNWFAGCPGGSPGRGYAPCLQANLIFSELNYNSAPFSDAGDWLEIHNLSSEKINLSGWILKHGQDSVNYYLPANTYLLPNNYVVICNNVDKFKTQHHDVTNFAGPVAFELSSKGEAINLYDSTDVKQTSMSYGDSLPWPMEANGKGKTMELLDSTASPNNSMNWFEGCPGGSPGGAYRPCLKRPIIISEINYNSSTTADAGDWLELHNIGADTAVASGEINISKWKLKLGNDSVNYYLPMNTFLLPQNYLVLCNNLTKFKSQHPDIINCMVPLAFELSDNGESINLYDSIGFEQISVIYHDSLPWPAGANGKGKTLELMDSSGNMSNGLNWFDGCPGGSPGKAYSPCLKPPIVFSEINYNSSPTADAGDWVELNNITSDTIDISGLTFKSITSNDNFQIPDKTKLAPGAYLVICNDIDKFKTQHPDVSNYIGIFKFDLSNNKELIQLLNSRGIVQMQMTYDDITPWPNEANGNGKTLELLDAQMNLSNGSNWFAGCPGGSPGEPYTPPCNSTLGIDNISTNFTIHLSSNPSNNSVVINIVSKNIKDISYVIYDITGRAIKSVTSINNSEIIMNKSEYPSGIYTIKISDYNKGFFVTERIIFP